MSVRLKYAGDKDIPVGRAGSLSISAPVSLGFPAAGTLLSTLDDTVLSISNYPSVLTVNVPYVGGTITEPSQTGDIPVRADGSGGAYQDYTTVTDIKYIQNAVEVPNVTGLLVDPINIVISGTSYPNGTGNYGQVYHNGSGGWYVNSWNSRSYVGYGEPFVINEYLSSDTPLGMMNDGRANGYWSDNNGGYFDSTGGIINISGSNVYRSNGGYWPYGTYLGYDGMSTYYWNGSGGYYMG